MLMVAVASSFERGADRIHVSPPPMKKTCAVILPPLCILWQGGTRAQIGEDIQEQGTVCIVTMVLVYHRIATAAVQRPHGRQMELASGAHFIASLIFSYAIHTLMSIPPFDQLLLAPGGSALFVVQ